MRPGLAATMLVACSFSTTIPDDNSGMIDAPPLDTKPLAPCPSAPAGCVQFDCLTHAASCYYYCSSPQSSGTANNSCKAIASGSCLVTLDDAKESACILAAAGGTGLVYLGLLQGSGAEPSANWGWYCGPATSYPAPLPWDTGEPNDAGTFGEDCGATKTSGKWVDVGCNESYRYVCEAPRPAATQ